MSTFAHVLKEIGEFGLFQKRLVAILCIPSLFVSFDVIGQVFTGMSFPHRCNTDWIMATGPGLTEEMQKNLTIPVRDDGAYESCRMFEPVPWDLEDIQAYGLNRTSQCTNGTVFEAPQGSSSIVTAVSVQFCVELHLYPLVAQTVVTEGKFCAKLKIKYAVFFNLHYSFSMY